MSIAVVNDYISKSSDFKDKWYRIWKEEPTLYELRIFCWELFTEEYWTTFFNGMKDYSPDDLKDASEWMFQKIVDFLEQKRVEEIDDGQKVSLQYLLQRLQTEYGDDSYRLLKKYGDYSERERILLKNMDEHTTICNNVSIRDLTDEMARLKEDIDRRITKLSEVTDQMIKCTEQFQDSQAQLAGLQRLNGAQNNINDLNSRMRQLQQSVDNQKKEIFELISRLRGFSVDAYQRLREEMGKFKKELQMDYVDLKSSDRHVPLELEEGYASFGKSMFELLRYTVLRGRQLSVDLQSENFKGLLHGALMDSFITLDQKRHNIKVELGTKKQKKKEIWQGEEEDQEITTSQKFKCPKFSATVRLLAADKIDSKVTVKAQFCQEDEVNTKCSTGHWGSECRFQLKPDTDETPFEKKKAQACFKKLELKHFERKQQDRHVCEDKFRILFTTSILIADEKIDVQTVSLPIVVTTGASQICNVYGSLLWHCYSVEDAFSMPIQSVEELPWCDVFDMLDKKFLTLNGRHLSQDEKNHLGARLMQYNDSKMTSPLPVLDTTMVPFRKFCIDKMMDIKEGDDKRKSATFWMWIHAIFNLVKNHLLDYWIDGLIAGFVSRASTYEILMIRASNPCQGLYLLRFSDKVITDGQGQNVCGAVTVAFVIEDKGKLKVENATPFKAENLKKRSLATSVKRMIVTDKGKEDTICKVLYPGEKSTEEVFKSYTNDDRSKKDRPPDYYVEFLEKLELQMNGLSIEDKDRERPKKRASRPSKRGGKMQRGDNESILYQRSPTDSTCSSQIPMTVMEQEGSGESMDQMPSSVSGDESSNDHMLVCPQPIQVSQQQQGFVCQGYNNDPSQNASIFTSSGTMYNDPQGANIDNIGAVNGSFLADLNADLNAPWDNNQQTTDYLLQNITVQQQPQQDQQPFDEALFSTVDIQNPLTTTQAVFPDQSSQTVTMQSMASAITKRTPSSDNPTLASLLQTQKQSQYEANGNQVASQSSASSQRHSDPVVMTVTDVSTSQADLVLNTVQPQQVSRSLSLGERKVHPSKPLSSKIESFEKLTNKLQPVQTSCSDNFPVAPSPADSGISVNSPINPNLILGDVNGSQPYTQNLGESPPMSDLGNIPNVIEHDTTDRARFENSVTDGNVTPQPATTLDLQQVLASLPPEQILPILNLIVQGQAGGQIQGRPETPQSSTTPNTEYNVPDSTMSPENGSNDQKDIERKLQ